MDYFVALRAFVKAVELGSLTKGAEAVKVKVPTMTRYIEVLEGDLGTALLNRSTKNLQLTEGGTIFYERVSGVLADLDEARLASSAKNLTAQGLLRVNLPAAFGRRHIVPHLKDFLSAYPAVRLDATFTDATVDLIESGADVAVRIGALADSSIISKRLAPHRRALVASPEYLNRHKPLLKPVELSAMECLAHALQPAEVWYFRARDSASATPIPVPINGRFRANDSEALMDAALDGLGIALLPTWLVGRDIQTKRLIECLPSWELRLAPGPIRAIWAVYPPKKVVPPKVQAFISFLEGRFGSPPYWDKDVGGDRKLDISGGPALHSDRSNGPGFR